MNGFDSVPPGPIPDEWRELAENVKDTIGEIIEYHLKQK